MHAGVIFTGAVAVMLFVAPAAGQPSASQVETLYSELQDMAATCDDPRLERPAPHVVIPDRQARELLAIMLRTDPEQCPGLAAGALTRLQAWVGEPERYDVDTDLLRLLHRATERGLGGPANHAQADRLGRILWLFDGNAPALPRWSEADRDAWLVRPETIALLEARVASPLREARVKELLGIVRLRRDLPGYDPERAVSLLEQRGVAVSHAQKVRVSRLLTDGEHLRPDFARAARPFLWNLRYADHSAEAQQELLRIGKLAAAAARTSSEQAAALRILWAAALDDRFGADEERDALFGRVGPVDGETLLPEDGQRVADTVAREIPIFGISPPEDGSVEFSPVLLRALIGPDGRVVAVTIKQSSGSPLHDRAVLGVWAESGHMADLSATSRGRFVMVDLPPIVPRYAVEPLKATLPQSSSISGS
jgi:hypothetical protein